MRAVARQSARLASTLHKRHPSRPQGQSFSRSAHQPIDRGRHGPPDHPNSLDVHREEQGQTDNAVKTVEKHGADSETQSAENRRLAIGKTRRQRRKEALAPDIPQPPPIPDWFIKHNVKLYSHTAKPSHEENSAIRCVDTKTGHTLFVVPHYESRPISGLQKTESAKEPKNQPLDGSFFTPSQARPKTTSQTILIPPSEEADCDMNPHTLLRWALLEAETAIRAGFTAVSNASHASLGAASRVDLSLSCPDSETHEHMDELVEDLAALVKADVVRLDANDFEDLLAEYVGQGSDAPGSFSQLAYDVFDGYESTSGIVPNRAMEEEEDDEIDENDEEDEDHSQNPSGNSSGFNSRTFRTLDSLRKVIDGRRHELGKALGSVHVATIPISGVPFTQPQPSRHDAYSSMGASDAQQHDDARLSAILNSLIDASKLKRDLDTHSKSVNESLWRRLKQSSTQENTERATTAETKLYHASWRFCRSDVHWYPDIAGALVGQVSRAAKDNLLKLESEGSIGGTSNPDSRATTRRTIIHIRDLKDISNSRVGESIIRALIRVVQKRRRAGQEILVVGTTAQDASDRIFSSVDQNPVDEEFRSMTMPPIFNLPKEELSQIKPEGLVNDVVSSYPYRRILEINLRHVQSMLSRLRPADSVDLFSETSQEQLHIAGGQFLSAKILTHDQVQRLVLTAIGLSQTHVVADAVHACHIGLAIFVCGKADLHKQALKLHKNKKIADAIKLPETKDREGTSPRDSSQAKMDKLKKGCNPHESKLLPSVVDPSKIQVGFKEVHAPPETIDALKTMTSLSLLRPEAFKYGVLAADRLPGLMLYGPPGTGKTLLAKAVAKESRATVLEISGAQIYEKYVGEGEKMVRAVFSLANKLSQLSPCVVFIDEADAIFGSRGNSGNRSTHREIINQFLREWDGMGNNNVFIMVATNRPFDMDDAVLRRLPRRILVDLPVVKDRESILNIHLAAEKLDETVKLKELAENTPFYSGSDLKNLCVSAALACVREENELESIPETRTLSARHFEKAIKEISASISEDMSSLAQIRKFDEKYGDRRGRKKKPAYGFGGDAVVDESAVRVRQTDAPPPPPSI